VSKFICVSQALKTSYVNEGIVPEKMEVIYNVRPIGKLDSIPDQVKTDYGIDPDDFLVSFVGPLIKRKGLDTNKVEYSGIKSIPELFVDPALMTLVVFDLLDNSIKYSKKHKPGRFKIEIVGVTVSGGYEIEFRDYGIGIPKGWEGKIFEPGIRTIEAHQHDPMGEGFGLWFANEIVTRHNGRLTLKRRSNPTIFVIFLPESLNKEPP